MEVTPALDSFDNNKELTKGNKLGKALPDNFEEHQDKDKSNATKTKISKLFC